MQSTRPSKIVQLGPSCSCLGKRASAWQTMPTWAADSLRVLEIGLHVNDHIALLYLCFDVLQFQGHGCYGSGKGRPSRTLANIEGKAGTNNKKATMISHLRRKMMVRELPRRLSSLILTIHRAQNMLSQTRFAHPALVGEVVLPCTLSLSLGGPSDAQRFLRTCA